MLFTFFYTSRFATKHHPRSEIIWSLLDISTIFKNECFIYGFSMIFMSLCLLRCWWLIHLRWCSLCWLDLPTASCSKHLEKKKVCSQGGTMPTAFYIIFTSRFAIKHHPRSEIIWSLMDIKNGSLPLALLVAHPPSVVQSLLAGPANS